MKLEKILKGIHGISCYQNIDMTNYSTIRLRARGTLIRVFSQEGLKKTVQRLFENDFNYLILGLGANQLLRPFSSTPYLKLDLPFDKSILNTPHDRYSLPASLTLNILSSHAIKFGIKGWEAFTGIPATLGGAVCMNAGTKFGEIGGLVKGVKVISRRGEENIIKTDNKSFSYRNNNFLKEGDIIYQVDLSHKGHDKNVGDIIKNYLRARKKEQPLNALTCGCVFKNLMEGKRVYRAGRYIDMAGLKGFVYKKLRISPVHANFVENLGDADYNDFIEFIRLIQDKLNSQFGIKFEMEIKV